MLPRGSITKVYEYYFTTPRYNNEIMRAMREFFDRPDLDRDGSLETNEKSEGLFNEWFLYDFELSSGNTVLADFVASNPLELSEAEMTLYHDLLETNTYGVFEVKKVDINNSLTLKNLQTRRTTDVREQKLTHQVTPGDIFFGRIGKVNDHYELIGADTFSLREVDETTKKSFLGIKFKLTPKIAHEIWKRQ